MICLYLTAPKYPYGVISYSYYWEVFSTMSDPEIGIATRIALLANLPTNDSAELVRNVSERSNHAEFKNSLPEYYGKKK